MKRIIFASTILILSVGSIIAIQINGNNNSDKEIQAFSERINDQAGEISDRAGDDATRAGDDATEETRKAPAKLGTRPELEDLDGWLQTEDNTTGITSFDGQVRIVQFWTFGCFNCKNTLPFLKEIYDTYEPEGLEIIGVHSPEFDWEKNPDSIQAAAIDLGVTWPIALDTEKENFETWRPKNRGWPLTYVLDQNGEVRFERKGEGQYDKIAETVDYLLENGP